VEDAELTEEVTKPVVEQVSVVAVVTQVSTSTV
jgi:hypothetical protein